ncbi:hypothetical protein [Nocardia sp. IFM 10818]
MARYICTYCGLGWHETPICPVRTSSLTAGDIGLHRQMQQLPLAYKAAPEGTPVFRVRWLVYAALIFAAYLALLIIF